MELGNEIPELLVMFVLIELKLVLPVGVLKSGGLKVEATGERRKTSSSPVRSDNRAYEFCVLIAGGPVAEKIELLKFGVWHLKQIQT